MGSRRAELEEFCAAAYPRLVGALALHCGDRYLAEDLAQEALLRACRHWARVRLMQSPVGWTYRVGANLSTSQARRRSAEDRALTRAADVGPDSQDATDRDAAIDIASALRLLPDSHRGVVLMRYQLGLTAAETAEVLGTTPAAVRQLSVRALKGLRAHVAFDADDLEPETRHAT